MIQKYYAGLDIGACATKVVIIDDQATVSGSSLLKTGISYEQVAEECFKQALDSAGLTREDVAGTMSTGYGRSSTSISDWDQTEISCLAKGAYHFFPRSIYIVDIGGQDNKMIKLDDSGRRVDFQMNRKCAAGTGAFLEEIANRLDLRLDEIESLARKSTSRVELGSYCTVFTFSEILAHMQRGVLLEDLVRGALLSIGRRIHEFGISGCDVVLSGGVIEHIPLIAEILKVEYQINVLLPPRPQFLCAFGAALLSRERYNST